MSGGGLPINLTQIPVVIADGASLSAEVPLGANRLIGIAMPATWTAAVLTFQTSLDDWATLDGLEVYDDAGNEISFTVAAGCFILVPQDLFRSINAFKIRSGTAAAAVNQGAARTLTLIVAPLT